MGALLASADDSEPAAHDAIEARLAAIEAQLADVHGWLSMVMAAVERHPFLARTLTGR